MKKIIFCGIIAIIIAVAVFGTTAYYSDNLVSGRNPLIAGNMDVEVIEKMLDPVTGELIDFSGPLAVMPATQVSKIVTVRNVGTLPAYVRISVEKTYELRQRITGDPSLIGLDINTEYWIEQDGYYYYKAPLMAGSQTQPLFTVVSFAANMSNEYAGGKAIVSVNVDAVQANENGNTVLEARGWPNT